MPENVSRGYVLLIVVTKFISKGGESGTRPLLFILSRNLDSLGEEYRSLVYSAFKSVSKSRMFALGLGFSNNPGHKGLGRLDYQPLLREMSVLRTRVSGGNRGYGLGESRILPFATPFTRFSELK